MKPRRGLVLLLQNPELGGAERSLLESLRDSKIPRLLLLSGEGALSEEAKRRHWQYECVPRPALLDSISLRSGSNSPSLLAFAFLPFAALLYALRIAWVLPWGYHLRTLGVKSHLAALLLLPLLWGRWEADIRDFIRPMFLRRSLAWLASIGACHVFANSRAVAADYPGATVIYPQVKMPRPPEPKQAQGGRRIISHVAYFAPYKGQDLFLDCAEAWLSAGLDAEFWIVGDVLYPAPEYARYRETLRRKAKASRFADRLRFLGALSAPEVQNALEQTHLLLHCTREPEPFGRSVLEALRCGCDVICHRGSGVCEVTIAGKEWPDWLPPAPACLGDDYVALALSPEMGAEVAEPLG